MVKSVVMLIVGQCFGAAFVVLAGFAGIGRTSATMSVINPVIHCPIDDPPYV